jgi:hypothetical protein
MPYKATIRSDNNIVVFFIPVLLSHWGTLLFLYNIVAASIFFISVLVLHNSQITIEIVFCLSCHLFLFFKGKMLTCLISLWIITRTSIINVTYRPVSWKRNEVWRHASAQEQAYMMWCDRRCWTMVEYAATCKRLRALIQCFASSSSTDVLRSYVTARSSNPHSKSDRIFNAAIGNTCPTSSQVTKWRLLSFWAWHHIVWKIATNVSE